MTDRGRRFGKGIAIALAVHIIAAALLGILGYRFTQRPPQILEVTWGGGGGGGGKGSAAAEKGTAETAAATVQQQKQQSAPVRTDDIVDRKQKPQTDAEDEDFTEYTAQDAQAEPEARGFAMPKLSALLGKPVTPDDETEDADDGRDEK